MSVSMPRDSALLFDLDGTLVDTLEANYRSYRDSLAESGIDCPRCSFLPCYGGHWREFLPRLAGSGDHALLQRIHHRKQELYLGHLATVRINDPLVALLRAARPGWSTGLVTTASRSNANHLLAHLGLADAFDRIVTGDDVVQPKPAPDGYRNCLEALHASAASSLAFEDSPTGIAAARAAGLTVLVVSGFASGTAPD
jgi:beta-phosphoglucomutase